MQAGTDAHLPNLKLYSGIKLEKRAESIFDIINAIKDRTAEPILQPTEYSLLHGDIEDVRKAAQAEEVSNLLVKVLYDCKHAKESAEDLCDYIQDHTEFDAVCAHINDLGHIEKTGRKTKTLILGHHSDTKKKFEGMQVVRNQQYGTKYGSNDEMCILMASKSKLKKSKEDSSRFVVEFCKCFDENPDNMHLRAAQFRYVTMEFMQNDQDC